jgi:hypothetical protein
MSLAMNTDLKVCTDTCANVNSSYTFIGVTYLGWQVDLKLNELHSETH